MTHLFLPGHTVCVCLCMRETVTERERDIYLQKMICPKEAMAREFLPTVLLGKGGRFQ